MKNKKNYFMFIFIKYDIHKKQTKKVSTALRKFP